MATLRSLALPRFPARCEPEEPKPLAIGEATGHAHRFSIGEYRFWRIGSTRFVEVLTPAQLVHEEHKTLTIAPGIYEQVSEREFDYTQLKEDYRPATAYVRP